MIEMFQVWLDCIDLQERIMIKNSSRKVSYYNSPICIKYAVDSTKLIYAWIFLGNNQIKMKGHSKNDWLIVVSGIEPMAFWFRGNCGTVTPNRVQVSAEPF